MKCSKCKWLNISNYIFKDGARSVVCDKHKKFLGFTDKKGRLKDLRVLAECTDTGTIKIKTKEKEYKRKNSKSGVKGIYWSEKDGKWKCVLRVGSYRACIWSGSFDDLEVAKAEMEKARREYYLKGGDIDE